MSPPGDPAAAHSRLPGPGVADRPHAERLRACLRRGSGGGADTRVRSWPSALGTTSDQVAFERALRQADEEGWFTQLGERLIHDGFFPRQSATVTDLQAVLSVALGFTDASVVETGRPAGESTAVQGRGGKGRQARRP